MRYSVKQQYSRGTDLSCAEFNDLADAKLFIENKLQFDKKLNVKVTYKIFEFNEIIDTFDPNHTNPSSQSHESQGSSNTSSFRPTPFNTAPKPTGVPHKWSTNDDEDKKK